MHFFDPSVSAHPPEWYYDTQASPSAYYPAHSVPHDSYALQGDPRLLSIVQHAAKLELGKLKLLESKYRGKELRRWAASFADTFGHVDGVEAALGIVLRNEGIEGDAAPFVETLVHALRDAQSAQPASVARGAREPSRGRAPGLAQPAAAAATRRADSPQRARLQSWLQSPAVAEIDEIKRRRILSERALISEFPLRTPEARDAWAERFCDTYFPFRQEFYKEDVNALLRGVVERLGVTGAESIAREASLLMQALSKVGVCNTKNRVRKRVRPAQSRAS